MRQRCGTEILEPTGLTAGVVFEERDVGQ